MYGSWPLAFEADNTVQTTNSARRRLLSVIRLVGRWSAANLADHPTARRASEGDGLLTVGGLLPAARLNHILTPQPDDGILSTVFDGLNVDRDALRGDRTEAFVDRSLFRGG